MPRLQSDPHSELGHAASLRPVQSKKDAEPSFQSSLETVSQFLPIANINLPVAAPSAVIRPSSVQQDRFEGLKEQLMREIEPQIKRLVEARANEHI